MATIELDKGKTALLMTDFHHESLIQNRAVSERHIVENARDVLQSFRNARVFVAYVVVNFRLGYPEVSARNKWFSMRKASGKVPPDDPRKLIHPLVVPLETEPVIVKHRVNAFFGTDLEMILRARGITTLVLMGHATSGVVLSTIRCAADMDYEIFVVEDGCADLVPEVHRVLMENVFPRQASVVSSKEMIDMLGAE